jgi:hypothetical protein
MRGGEPVTGKVAVPGDSDGRSDRMAAAGNRLSDSAVIALRALCDVLARPNADSLPAEFGQEVGTRGSTTADWRAEFYGRAPSGPDHGDDPVERKRKKHKLESQFSRAVGSLLVSGRVGMRDGWAWLPGTPAQ